MGDFEECRCLAPTGEMPWSRSSLSDDSYVIPSWWGGDLILRSISSKFLQGVTVYDHPGSWYNISHTLVFKRYKLCNAVLAILLVINVNHSHDE